MTNQEAKTFAKDVMAKCPFPAFATVDEAGCPQIRAMMPVLVDDDFTIYYITGRPSTKCQHIAANPGVSTLWTEVINPMENWRSVLIKSSAVVTDDKALRDRFWMEELRGFFPGGADDPNYVIVVCKPAEMILADQAMMPPQVIKF